MINTIEDGSQPAGSPELFKKGGRKLDKLPSLFVAFLDVDGTMTTGNSWMQLTEGLSTPEQTETNLKKHREAFTAFRNKKITYDAAIEFWVKLWNDLKISPEKVKEIFSGIEPREGARDLVDFLHLWSVTCCILTGSLEEFAEIFAGKLGVSRFFANAKFNWDKEGKEGKKLINFDYYPDQAARKLEQLTYFLDNLNVIRSKAQLPTTVGLENCIVIGDGDNDLEIFRVAGLAIAIIDENNPNNSLIELAHFCVSNLEEALLVLIRIRIIQMINGHFHPDNFES